LPQQVRSQKEFGNEGRRTYFPAMLNFSYIILLNEQSEFRVSSASLSLP